MTPTRRITACSHRSFSDPWSEARAVVGHCLRCLWRRDCSAEDLARIRETFERLPWDAAEFGVACHRLQNATRYLQYNEAGAAAYELRLLMGKLATPPIRQPQRRLVCA